MLIRKRWLLAAAAGSALVYLSGHYRIGGLDQLRIEPRPASSAAELYEPSGQGGNDSWLFPAASAPSGSHRPNSAGPTAPSLFDNLPPWEPQLSVGEKLAVMQQRISDQVASIGGQSIAGSTLLPVNVPIPAPAELDLIRPSGSPGQSPTARRSGPGKPAAVNPVAGPAEQNKLPRIRIASLNLVAFGDSQLEKPQVVDGLATLLREFDIVALQGIQSDRDDILPTIVERLNRLGRQYDYLIGPRVGRGSLHQQFAFVFDTAQAETDRYQLYTVDDPEDLIMFEPLVAWFRCTQGDPATAFTFSLVNLRISQERLAAEQAILPNLIHAVVNDGRREDDVIVLGDFGDDVSRLGNLQVESIRFACRGVPTDLGGQQALSNLLFSSRATCEFTGRSGVSDFLRRYNLSIEQAQEISPSLPVWAEFYAVEGAQPGKVAP